MKALIRTKFFLIILLVISLLGFVISAKAQSCSGKEDCDKKIVETEQRLTETRNQKSTLSSQINLMDTQIYLTSLKIQDTQNQIAATEAEIGTLTERIDGIDTSLDYLTRLLLKKIAESYKRRDVPFIAVFLDSESATVLANRLKYARVTQQNDQRVAFQLQQAKLNFEEQKDLRERKVAELDQLKASLDAQNEDLTRQKQEKQQLLAITQSDERRFQVLLAHLKADAASINAALGNIGVKIGPVNKGDVIAGVGSTGCSTGPHLHLEVYTDAKVEGGRVVGNRVDPKSYLENSSYDQPLPGYYPGSVTTWYGEVYFLGVHTGIDIAAPFNTPIRAMESGDAYATSATCSYNGSLGKGIVIDHKNGLVSLYWHIP